MADQNRNPRNSNTTLFKKLTRLFSGPLVNRRKQTYRKLRRSHLNVFGSKFRSVTGQNFQKSSYNPFETLQAQRIQNQNRAERYREFDQMEFNPDISCLTGDTEIATLAGFETIKDLADKKVPFEVWAWDEENCKYTVAMGRYAQKTGEKETVIVKLDNGEQFECTADHRIMLKDGSYKQAQNLGSNEALMPFNYKFNKHHGYMEISNPFKPKYKYAHRYIFEDVFEKEIGSNNIRHINHNKRDNRTSNLMEMSPKGHMLLHGRHPTTRNKKSNWTKERWKNADEEERNQILSGLRAWQSSEEGKDFMSRHTSHLNRERWKNDPQYAEKMSKIFSNHAKELWQNPEWAEWKRRHHSEVIKRKYANDPDYAEKTKHIGPENGSFYNEVTTEEVLEEGHKYNTLKEFAKNFDFKGKEFKKSQYATQFLRRRIVSAGFNGWRDYKENYEYSNHKVVSIEKTGEVKEVYDLNVPHYHNFALKCGAIVSNSAMDIYADEMTTSNEMNDLLSIKTPNEEIKTILHALYYDILGIEHNLFGWVRTMCKFGDFFLYLDIDKIDGVQSVMGLPAEQIERLEGEDVSNPNYIQYQWNNTGLTFENWQMAHFRILGNDKFAPYGISVLNNSRRVWRQLCVQENMQVTTKNGPKEIKNIKKDDIVYAFNPETKKIEETKVVACKSMGKQDVYDVKTRNKSIKVTYDHGLLVYNNQKNEYGYKAPRDIKTGKYGDRLAVPVVKDGKSSHSVSLNSEDYRVKITEKNNGIARKNDILECDTDYSYKNIHAFFNDEKKISYSDFEKVKRNHNLSSLIKEYKLYPKRSKREANIDKNLEYTVDSEFCRFFGFMLGDGWANDNNKLGFALGEYEDQNKDYKNLLQKFFNGKMYLTEAGNGRGGQVNIHSSEGIRIMKKLGFTSGAEHKEVPKWIYGMDLECRREFVKGFFDADGSYSDGRVTSINKTLLEGIKKVCGMSGIPAYDIKNDKKEEIREFTNGNTSLCKASYHMYINMNEDKWFDDYELQKVKSIELYEENAETYDLQVENDLHNFIVEDIVSHNTLLEDSMMAYRIVRSPERRVFYIDVGNINPNDVEQYMEKIISNMKRHQVIDEDSGRVDLRYNPLSVDEDYFIPVRGQTNTKVESLPGGNYVGDIDDVKYLRDKLYSALKIPQSYLSRDEGASEDKTTLAQKDIRFARTITRLQRPVVSELEKIGIIHLLVLGYPEEDAINFSLSLRNPSQIAMMQELENWRTKFDVASQATEHFSKRWVMKNIFNLSDEKIVRIFREKHFDAKFDAQMEQIAAGAEEGLGGGLGGELGAEDLSGPEDEFDMDAGMEDTEDLDLGADTETDAGEDDEGLLATPGKRDLTTTPRSKGKMYKPVKTDKRDMGARKKNMKSKYADEKSRNTRRTIVPGLDGLTSYSKGIMEKRDDKVLIKEMEDLMNEEKEVITNSYADFENKIFARKDTLENIKENIDEADKISGDDMKKLQENIYE